MKENGLKVGSLATFALAFSLFTVAAAIVYFTYEIAQVRKQIPEILARVKLTTNEIGPVVKEVSQITKLIPPILNEVAATREAIPPILEEVAATRAAIPSMLEDVEETRKLVPPILAEVEKTRQELPAVLKSVDNASWAVVQTAKQVKAVRPMIPEVLKEIEATRNVIPPTLDRLDLMIERARVAGQEASEGAVTGVFTGILKAPFKLIGGTKRALIGKDKNAAKHFTDDDIKQLHRAVEPLTKASNTGVSQSWRSPSSDLHGTLVLKRIYSADGTECRDIQLQASKGSTEVVNKLVTLCRTSEGGWEDRSGSVE